MGRSEVDAVLERLVAQFASPYDFLRELVQNSMDAGSDRVEVSLECHEDGEGGAVFELVAMDTGVGMDEAILDGAFTRLFSSSKADDRTMAGGFGVGFVSVFAWAPQVVMVQTGRGGEAWELIFFEDRSFEKHRLETPFEGTTITMFRRDDAGNYPAVVEAVRDSLWRWCRYCPIEISFEDLGGDAGPELIQDAPARDEQVLARRRSVGDGEIHLAFAVPSHAVLTRRGLILAEGAPASLVEALGAQAHSVDHLQLWIDSPELETTLARDKVVESEGRRALETAVLGELEGLRADLLAELVALAQDPAPWSAAKAGRYGTLHAHLQLEWGAMASRIEAAAILRAAGPHAWTPAGLREAIAGGPLLWAPIDGEPPRGDYPVVHVAGDADRIWLEKLAARFGTRARALDELRGEAKPFAAGESGTRAKDFAARIQAWFEGRVEAPGLTAVRISMAEACDGDDKDPPLCAWDCGGWLLTGREGLPARALGALWLDGRHLLVKAARRAHGEAALLAELTLVSAIATLVEIDFDAGRLADYAAARREALEAGR